MKLFSYQEAALLAIFSDPSRSQLISMPTGTGKTITFLAVAKEKNLKTLILVHRKELLDQTYDKAQKMGFNVSDISLITSENKMELRRLNIAMVPTLIRNLPLYAADDIEMIIVDEAHHATARSYRKIFQHFEVVEKDKWILGFTATPLRGDASSLSDIFASHSFKITLSEATQKGYICPVYGVKVQFDKDLSDIEMKQGDYDISKLDRVMNCDEINDLVVEKCSNIQKTPGLIFCTSVDHARKIAKRLRKKGKKAISVSYLTPKKTLAKIFQLLYQNKIHYITNAVKLSEGFDHPPIQAIIIARPTRSPVLYKQMIGRGLRNFKNKKECLVVEFTGNDDKMMRWENIDENATFQSYSASDNKSFEEALSIYKTKFPSPNVRVLNVRISPFNFYECYIQRKVKYGKDFIYYPGNNGFEVFKLIAAKDNWQKCPAHFGIYMYAVFWKEPYKSFYIWSEGDPSGASNTCTREKVIGWIEKVASDAQINTKRWYPSEEGDIAPSQKSMLKTTIKMNARKAEMFIEDAAIKEAIKKYWIPNNLEKVLYASHETKVYELSGRY